MVVFFNRIHLLNPNFLEIKFSTYKMFIEIKTFGQELLQIILHIITYYFMYFAVLNHY